MSTVYKVIVSEQVGSDGMGLITLVGELTPIGEETYVRCGQVLHTSEGWYVDRSEADRDAADVVEARAARLLAQATRLRGEEVGA